MLDKTLGYILCCQSPGLFLAAAVLVIAYFAGRKKHRFKAEAAAAVPVTPPAPADAPTEVLPPETPAQTPEEPAPQA